MQTFSNNIPEHVAIIMDGNGRWAKEQGLPRSAGHKKGVETLRQVVTTSGEIGVKYLTLFAFSSENWSRPAEEVGFLMGLLKTFMKRDLGKLRDKNVRVRIIGGRENLQLDILKLLLEAEESTAQNTGLNLVIAFNYGARDEIARATKRIAADVKSGLLDVNDINECCVSSYLDTRSIPDPELIIRSSGEQRLSNFLLWQAAYSEFVFVDELWPDFTKDVYLCAIDKFKSRERRFGGVVPQKVAVTS
ncbi:isoprenyl transferase [Lentilitoribacter sp. EG35]|uniref:isoprenyl transferase n=1 Tax=Lentilitoribacter sp. EG35 TaxID=3234192 RepID=UPI00346034FD